MVKRGMTPEKAREIRRAKGIKDTNLQKQRIKKGLSQNELSIVSGVSERAIRSYEQQERPIDRANLETLCDLSMALGCGIEEILESKTLIDKFKYLR